MTGIKEDLIQSPDAERGDKTSRARNWPALLDRCLYCVPTKSIGFTLRQNDRKEQCTGQHQSGEE